MFKAIEQESEVYNMAYDYSKLKGRIVEKYGNQTKFAEIMGLSERTMSLKLNNTNYWKQNEISKACKLLDINEDEIKQYFFNLKVQ